LISDYPLRVDHWAAEISWEQRIFLQFTVNSINNANCGVENLEKYHARLNHCTVARITNAMPVVNQEFMGIDVLS
jgi:hypothetical protein